MTRSLLVALVLTVTAAATLTAQLSPRPAAANWVSVYGQMYTGMGSLEDPDSDTRWAFADNSFGLGATLLRHFGESVLLGADVSIARPDYEAQPLTSGDTITGGSTVATAMLLGRVGGGAAQLGFYLTGGLGTIAYRLNDHPSVDGWNNDFALRAGTGLEYRFRPNGAAFLEWGRIWGYHEKEGVSGGRVTHSLLKLGGRLGF